MNYFQICHFPGRMIWDLIVSVPDHCLSFYFIEFTALKIGEKGERGGSVVACRTPERKVGGSKPTAAVLCP